MSKVLHLFSFLIGISFLYVLESPIFYASWLIFGGWLNSIWISNRPRDDYPWNTNCQDPIARLVIPLQSALNSAIGMFVIHSAVHLIDDCFMSYLFTMDVVADLVTFLRLSNLLCQSKYSDIVNLVSLSCKDCWTSLPLDYCIFFSFSSGSLLPRSSHSAISQTISSDGCLDGEW